MLISSDANAAEAIVPGHETRFYDDIGCMAGDRSANQAGARRFVRLASDKGWLEVETAYFAASTAVTPMAHGVVAFATETEARAADSSQQARRWLDIVRMTGGL
jgi:hypothetical protein